MAHGSLIKECRLILNISLEGVSERVLYSIICFQFWGKVMVATHSKGYLDGNNRDMMADNTGHALYS